MTKQWQATAAGYRDAAERFGAIADKRLAELRRIVSMSDVMAVAARNVLIWAMAEAAEKKEK